MSDNSCSAGMPCEAPDTLWVEVAGEDLDEHQGLVLERNGEAQATLERAPHELHQRFQCEYAPEGFEAREYTLTLTVEQQQGEPIRLPLLDHPVPTQRSETLQPNRLFPIYPMAQLPFADGERSHAAVRPGFIYIFWKGILWRELAVDDQTQFSDVNLADWREKIGNNAADNPDERAATGKTLEAIWVPANLKDNIGETNTLGALEITWSEVQWSWDYIRALETGMGLQQLPAHYRELTGLSLQRDETADEMRKQRCVDLDCLKSYSHCERFGPDSMKGRDKLGSSDHRWGPIHVCRASRPRNPARELLAANPATVTRTLDGNGLLHGDATILHDTKREMDVIRDKPCKLAEMTRMLDGVSNWVCKAQGQTENLALVDKQAVEEGQADKADRVDTALEDDGGDSDLLEPLREKAIAAVFLPDPMFELGWHTTQASLYQHHLTTLVESAQSKDHIHSAMLLQRHLFDTPAGQTNPHRDVQQHVDTDKLDEVLNASDRKDCREHFYEHTAKRIDCLKRDITVAALRDYFTLNDVHYLLAFDTLGHVLGNLDTELFQFDPLAGETDKNREAFKAEQGRRFLASIARGEEEVSDFIAASEEQVPVETAYEPGEEEANDGSGRFRPGLLAALQRRTDKPDDLPPELEARRTLSEEQHEQFLKSLEKDADLKAWADATSTQMAGLVAETLGLLHEQFHEALLAVAAREGAKAIQTEIEMPTRLAKASNPLMRQVILTDGGKAANSGRYVVLGSDLNGTQTGAARLSEQRLSPLTVGGKASPDGRIPQMSIVSESRGNLMAQLQSSGGAGAAQPPSGTVTGKFFLVEADSPAARMPSTVAASGLDKALRWLPVGMLPVMTYNIWQSSVSFGQSNSAAQELWALTSLSYGGLNALYWLGELLEARQIQDQYRLTQRLYDTQRIQNQAARGVIQALSGDRFLTWARVAGAVAAVMEILYLFSRGVSELWRGNTAAGLGYLTASAGMSVATFGRLIGGTAKIVGLGVSVGAALTVVGLVVTIGALIWATHQEDSDLEIWVKQGPFGNSDTEDAYRHLKDHPQEAYQRLFALFFPLYMTKLSAMKLADRDELSGEEKTFLKSRGWTDATVVQVQSLALAMADEPAEQLRTQLWYHKVTTIKGRPFNISKAKMISPEFVHYDEGIGAVRFYLAAHYINRHTKGRLLKARVQLRPREGLVLPINALEEPLSEPKERPSPGEEAPRWLKLA